MPAPAPVTYARNFLDASFQPKTWADISPIIAELLERPLPTRSDLEQWLLDISELEAVLDETGSKRWIAKDVNTEDKAAKQAFFDWIENIEPHLKPAQFKLLKRFASHPEAANLDPNEFRCYLRSARNSVEIFREANVPLETEASKLVTEYSTLNGAQTVTFDGKERTMQQMAKYIESPDRSVREQAFRLSAERREKDFAAMESIFDKLLALREQMAANVGMQDYRELRFRQFERFDYTPVDCLNFDEAIARVCVPRMRRLQAERAKKLGLPRLRPWDLSVDPTGTTPLDPFKSATDLIKNARKSFNMVDPALGDHFDILINNNLLDLESRKGKAPGGYQATLQERRMPFIFMNAAGLQRDVQTLLHEGGHAFHAIEQRPLRLTANRTAPIEFCEVASMSMELLANTYLDKTFYTPKEAVRARIVHLEGIINFFPWMATIDAFQHWLYTHPGHSHEARAKAWLELRDRYEGDVDWTGFENARKYRWMQQLHLFGAPFYYVDYGIAQLGALQVWRNYLQDPRQAISQYRYALSLGNTRTLPQLFEAAGIKFDFSANMLEELLSLVDKHLTQLRVQLAEQGTVPVKARQAAKPASKPAKKSAKKAAKKAVRKSAKKASKKAASKKVKKAAKKVARKPVKKVARKPVKKAAKKVAKKVVKKAAKKAVKKPARKAGKATASRKKAKSRKR